MSVDIFDKETFEKSLPRSKSGKAWCKSAGLKNGEETFIFPIDDNSQIEIRSSIDSSGVSASTGKDSIRAWLTDPST